MANNFMQHRIHRHFYRYKINVVVKENAVQLKFNNFKYFFERDI